jgi:hypothetical protein
LTNVSNSAINVAGTGLKLPLWAVNFSAKTESRIKQSFFIIRVRLQITHQLAFHCEQSINSSYRGLSHRFHDIDKIAGF